MRVNYKLIFFVMVLFAFLSIIYGIKEETHKNIIPEEKKSTPINYLTPTQIFNKMAQPSPWIYGFIDKNKPKQESIKYKITDRLEDGDEDKEYKEYIKEKKEQHEKSYPDGEYSSVRDIGEYDENGNLIIQ